MKGKKNFLGLCPIFLKSCKDVTMFSPFSNGIHDVGMVGGWISWHPNDPCRRVSSSPWVGFSIHRVRP
jgi:hypothetical protein